VQGRLLAAISPVNTPHGYNWTFAYPMLLFIIVAGVLYLRFRSPHKVPGHAVIAATRWTGAGPTAPTIITADPAAADPALAQAGTVAADPAVAGSDEPKAVADEPAVSIDKDAAGSDEPATGDAETSE
jgi:hypothetical protein